MVSVACVGVLSVADHRTAAELEPAGSGNSLSVVVAAVAGPPAPEPAVEVAAQRKLPFDPLSVGPFEEQVEAGAETVEPFETLLVEQPATVPYLKEVNHRFRFGETMSEVLDSVGVNPVQVDAWISAARKVYNLNRVYAGQELSMLVQRPQKELVRLELDIDPGTMLVAELTDEHIEARREPIVYDRSLRVIGGEIHHSLYMAAVSRGVPEKIISDMAEILGWEINFSTDLRPGSTFRVIYEELSRRRGNERMPGRVLAVEVYNRGRSHEGFYFEDLDEGHIGYYDRKGRGIGRDFLRYPVAFSRISSQFSTGRYHPVLKTKVPHYGVDFAAPTGTPVRAVADGKVLKAGWYGGNGRFVKLRHDSIYESGYSHLSRIPSALKAGHAVKKGQVIGYVGSTGLATGPHLHFALYRRGKYIDPLNADLPRARSIEGHSVARYRMTVTMLDGVYANAGKGPLVASR